MKDELSRRSGETGERDDSSEPEGGVMKGKKFGVLVMKVLEGGHDRTPKGKMTKGGRVWKHLSEEENLKSGNN